MKKLAVGVCAAVAAAVSAFGSMPPSPYVPVEYVQLKGDRTNPAKISTGIVVTDTMKIEFKVSLDDTENYGSAFKDYIDEDHNTTRIVRNATSANSILVCFHSKAGGSTAVTALNNATDPIEGWMKKGQANVNGVAATISTTQGTANDAPLCFQSIKVGSTRIYYLRIFNNGEPLVEYVPCVNANDPTDCGIWNGTEVLKSATGTVTAGPAATLAMDVIAPQTFTGSPLTPEVTVRFYGRALEAGVDYDVSYDNNTDPGEATVTVTGAGVYEGLNAQASFQITVENPFEVLDPQGASVGASAKFSEAFASCLAAGGGEIVLLAPATIDSRLAPAAADLSGKTVWIRSAEGRRYRLAAGTADAGFALPEVASVFSLKFKDVILDGGAVWVSDEVTDLSNGGLTRTASFIMLGGKNNYTYFDEGVVVENFHQGDAHYVIDSNAWSTRFYVDSADFIARRIRGGGFAHMGQNRQTYFRGTVTACYVTASALMNHDGANAGSAAYYDGTAICGNALKSGSYAVKLHVNWPANGLKLGSASAASKICICDNFVVGAQTCANIYPCKETTVQLVGPLTEDSSIGFSWPAAAPDEAIFAACSYTGELTPNVNRIFYDGNPVGGVEYVGKLSGSNLIWIDKTKDIHREQGEVFELSNDGGATWTAFDNLKTAFAAAADNAIVELVDNAFYEDSFTVAKSVTLRSRGANRFTLSRVEAAILALNAPLVVTDLVWDGGAVWDDPDDLANASCTGVRKANLVQAGGSSTGMLTLGANTWVRNVNALNAVFYAYASSGTANGVVLKDGALVTDCRGACPVLLRGNNGCNLDIEDATIIRCCNTSGPIFQVSSNHSTSRIGSCVVTGNVVAVGSAAIFKANNPNFTLTLTGGTVIVRDNVDAGGTAADYGVAEPNLDLVVAGQLTDDSDFRIAYPTDAESVPGTVFATIQYAGQDELNAKAFRYEFNPVEGVTYVGSVDGAGLSWADERSSGGIEQDEVFRVLNPGEEPQTFDRLENAFAAVYSNAVIELTADALYDKMITVGSKQVVLRSAEGPRRVLKRVKGVCITLLPTEVKDSTVTIENLIVDGGAEWSDPDDLGNAACTGVKSADLFVTGFHSAGWMQDAYGILTLGGGATVRNVNAASAVLHPTSENIAGTIVMLAGSEIVDCRGECPIVGAFGNGGQIQLNGGVITRCLGSVVVQRNGISQPAEIGAVTIVSNRVGTAALGQTSADNNGYFKFTGGVTVIRDNFTAGNEEKNANFWVRPHFSGSLEAGSDIRLGVSAGLGGNIIVDINEGDVIGALDAKGIKGGCYIHNLVNPKLTAVRAAVDDEDCFVWGKTPGLMLLLR